MPELGLVNLNRRLKMAVVLPLLQCQGYSHLFLACLSVGDNELSFDGTDGIIPQTDVKAHVTILLRCGMDIS